jgi:endonuclease/exonuclease/phosphatase family metal-dependent hydrolase
MSGFILKSWNVLHLVHEINHAFGNSPVLTKYGILTLNQHDIVQKEQRRLRDIADVIKSELNKNCMICLQEVPGDLLDMLYKEIQQYNILYKKHAREPKLKIKLDGEQTIYKNQAEFLVTIFSKSIMLKDYQIVQFDDPGKASLFIGIKNLYIINCHIPFGNSRKKALNQIFHLIKLINEREKTKINFIIVGDTNMVPSEFRNETKMYSTVVYESHQDTRKGLNRNNVLISNKLDYFIAPINIAIKDVFAHKNNDISDHSMVQCQVGYSPEFA